MGFGKALVPFGGTASGGDGGGGGGGAAASWKFAALMIEPSGLIETDLTSTPITLDTTQPATPTFSFTVAATDLASVTLESGDETPVYKNMLDVHAALNNFGTGSTRMIGYDIQRNGVTVFSGTEAWSISYQGAWHCSAPILGAEVGDVIDVYLWDPNGEAQLWWWAREGNPDAWLWHEGANNDRLAWVIMRSDFKGGYSRAPLTPVPDAGVRFNGLGGSWPDEDEAFGPAANTYSPYPVKTTGTLRVPYQTMYAGDNGNTINVQRNLTCRRLHLMWVDAADVGGWTSVAFSSTPTGLVENDLSASPVNVPAPTTGSYGALTKVVEFTVDASHLATTSSGDLDYDNGLWLFLLFERSTGSGGYLTCDVYRNGAPVGGNRETNVPAPGYVSFSCGIPKVEIGDEIVVTAETQNAITVDLTYWAYKGGVSRIRTPDESAVTRTTAVPTWESAPTPTISGPSSSQILTSDGDFARRSLRDFTNAPSAVDTVLEHDLRGVLPGYPYLNLSTNYDDNYPYVWTYITGNSSTYYMHSPLYMLTWSFDYLSMPTPPSIV